jgi:hypothetical protein
MKTMENTASLIM